MTITVYLTKEEAAFVASREKGYVRSLIRKAMGTPPDVRDVPDYRPPGLKR
jgi:hypothetical protein